MEEFSAKCLIPSPLVSGRQSKEQEETKRQRQRNLEIPQNQDQKDGQRLGRFSKVEREGRDKEYETSRDRDYDEKEARNKKNFVCNSYMFNLSVFEVAVIIMAAGLKDIRCSLAMRVYDVTQRQLLFVERSRTNRLLF